VIASAIKASFHSKNNSTPGDEDDGEDVLEEEDQAVAEEEAHALEVDGRPRHQLAGLVTVVEAEREPDEAGIEALAQIHLDRERLPARDHAAAEHQDRTNCPKRDDGADVHPQLVRVARRERVVDHVLRYPDEGDLTAPGSRSRRQVEIASEALYGRRNPSSRKKVWR
jgi:hypothetical protein